MLLRIFLLFPVLFISGNPMPISFVSHWILHKLVRGRWYILKTGPCLYRWPKDSVYMAFAILIIILQVRSWRSLDLNNSSTRLIARTRDAMLLLVACPTAYIIRSTSSSA